MTDPGFWLLFVATLAAGIAAGIAMTLLYLADKRERERNELDPAWLEFHRSGIQPRRHRPPYRAQ